VASALPATDGYLLDDEVTFAVEAVDQNLPLEHPVLLHPTVVGLLGLVSTATAVLTEAFTGAP